MQRRAGKVQFETVLLLSLVSVAGVYALSALGMGCQSAIGEGASSALPKTSQVELTSKTTAGLAKLAGAAQTVFRSTLESGPFVDHLIRHGDVAANLEIKSGRAPRVITSFPAGNSSVGVWFADAGDDVRVSVLGDLQPRSAEDGFNGVVATIEASADELTVDEALLGSTRFLRNKIDKAPDGVPAPVRVAHKLENGTAFWERTSFDGVHRYRLLMEPDAKTRIFERDGKLVLRADEGPLRVSLRAETDEPALTPISGESIFLDHATTDKELRDSFEFLLYEEKLLAGSWRYHTYFGRDSLMSAALAMDKIRPEAIEGILSGVIERLSKAGQVAHEEDIGDFAAWRRLQEGTGGSLDEPIFDYKMVDDDFMLPVVVERYLETHSERADAFLSRKTPSGESYADALTRNARFVLEQSEPYARSGERKDLISIENGFPVGQWRDSNDGLGGGYYPYDVNAVLVPAALRDVQRLAQRISTDEAKRLSQSASKLSQAWAKAGDHFQVALDRRVANRRLRRYARELGIEAPAKVDGPVEFPAIALDPDGKPVPVLHSDEAFALLFGELGNAEAAGVLSRVQKSFPEGLTSDAGLLIANPAYADSADLRKLFTAEQYHGTVSWSWHYGLYQRGIERQAALGAVDGGVIARSRAWIQTLLRNFASWAKNELWTFRVNKDRKLEPVAYGAGQADSEANLAQAWSAAAHL